jgi:hypothetical protein
VNIRGHPMSNPGKTRQGVWETVTKSAVLFFPLYKMTNTMHQMSNIYFVIKLSIFWASSVPIIRSYLLYTRQLVRFMRAMWPLPSRDRLELRTVDNSWWWAQKMPETCRVLWRNKYWTFDASCWLFYMKLIMMHGHWNIKCCPLW